MGLGIRVSGFRFRVEGLGIGASDLGLGLQLRVLGLVVSASGCSGLRAEFLAIKRLSLDGQTPARP